MTGAQLALCVGACNRIVRWVKPALERRTCAAGRKRAEAERAGARKPPRRASLDAERPTTAAPNEQAADAELVTRFVTKRADPADGATRRALLDRLRQGDAAVTALATGFKMSRPPVSQHLRVLREAHLVRERPGADGRQRIYQLTPEVLREVAERAEAYEAFWEASLANLKRHLEGEALEPPTKKPRR